MCIRDRLTARDMISYEKKIGGLNRASTVINELIVSVKQKDISKDVINYASVTSLQRLGFILDEVVNRKDIAAKLFNQCKKEGKTFYLILLKASGEKKKEVVNEKWKLIINTEIEFEN